MRRFYRFFWHIYTFFIKNKFGLIGKKTVILHPLQIDEASSIFIEDNVNIFEFAWLMGNKKKNKTLYIKRGCSIGHFVHIVAKNMINIEENVLIADKVFISDCTHIYNDVFSPIIRQDIQALGSVCIGEGSWLGENVCVCGANVGKHCVIAANSVVTKDIPDYCVAAGSPAKIVKKYNFETNMWEKV